MKNANFGLIRKKKLKMLLDFLEASEKSYCEGSEKEQIWLAGSICVIYGIAEYFGIELNSMKKDGNHNTKMDEKNGRGL